MKKKMPPNPGPWKKQTSAAGWYTILDRDGQFVCEIRPATMAILREHTDAWWDRYHAILDANATLIAQAPELAAWKAAQTETLALWRDQLVAAINMRSTANVENVQKLRGIVGAIDDLIGRKA